MRYFALYFAHYACKSELLGRDALWGPEEAAFQAARGDWGAGGQDRFRAEWYAPVMAGIGNFRKVGFTRVEIPPSSFWDGMTCGEALAAENNLVRSRMAALETGSPWPIRATVVRLIPGAHNVAQARIVESWFHDHYSAYRLRGEWFNVPRELASPHLALKAYTAATGSLLPTPCELMTADEPLRRYWSDIVWEYQPDGQLTGSYPAGHPGLDAIPG